MQTKRNTWAHKLVQRALDVPWPICFMDRWHVAFGWSAICGTLRLIFGADATHSMHYIWFSLVFAPYVLRMYFAVAQRRDLIIDAVDLLDMFLASHFLSSHHVYGAGCALLFIQMGLRPSASRPMSRQDAAALVTEKLHQHDADVRVLSPMFLGTSAATRKR